MDLVGPPHFLCFECYPVVMQVFDILVVCSVEGTARNDDDAVTRMFFMSSPKFSMSSEIPSPDLADTMDNGTSPSSSKTSEGVTSNGEGVDSRRSDFVPTR